MRSMRRFLALVLLVGGLVAAAACASSDSSPEPTRDPYGREGERCYSDYSCTVCNFGTGVCDACGSTGQVCCNDGVWCSTGNNCVAGSCEQCGIIGKTCCPGPNDCATGSCVQGNCQSCGTTGLICCPGQTCKGTVCKSGKCL